MATTRLGLGGFAREPYGSFVGKEAAAESIWTEITDETTTWTPISDESTTWTEIT